MKESFSNLPPEEGGSSNMPDENVVNQQFFIENRTITESSFSDQLESFFKKMKPLAMQNEAQLVHYQQLKENHHELEDAFQNLKSKYQNLQDDYKHLMDSHQKIEHEYKNYLQEVQFQHENAKKADQFINCVKTLMRDFEKIDDGNKDLEAKYFSLMDYFKFRGNRYYLTPVQTGKMHSILQKKSKDTGFEMRKIMMNGIEEITYHSYVLRISLGF